MTMKKSLKLTAAISFILGMLVMALFPIVSSAFAQANSDRTLHVIDHSAPEAFLDVPPAGDSLGDQFYFNDPVFNASNSKLIGSDQGICFRMGRQHANECHWTTYLPEGQISVEGPFDFPANSTVAIIGGTGAYQNARGEMTLHTRDPQGSQFDFFFHLIG
ncbi:MAG: dirigent protein [Chloroflexota bacterium]|nr:dirigent protein [Chloroflexota bacterium]